MSLGSQGLCRQGGFTHFRVYNVYTTIGDECFEASEVIIMLFLVLLFYSNLLKSAFLYEVYRRKFTYHILMFKGLSFSFPLSFFKWILQPFCIVPVTISMAGGMQFQFAHCAILE